MSEERCVRCGEVDEDRRTLWMSCMYEMGELKVPFEKRVLLGFANDEKKDFVMAKEPTTLELPGSERKLSFGGTIRTSSELKPVGLYTLRVCKECRGDWLQAIEKWFVEKPRPERESEEPRNIPVREKGAIRMLTESEYRARATDPAS